MSARPSHVGLNALWLNPAASGGPETYLRGLARALIASHPEARFTVVTSRSGRRALLEDGWGETCRVVALPCEDGQRGRRQLSEQVLLPLLARRARMDVVHSLASVAPIRTPGTTHVITLHDVTFFRMRTFGRLTTFGMRQVVSRAAHNADRLITATSAAREEICAELGLQPSAFAVIPHGVEDHVAAAPSPAAEVRARYALGDARLVMCVATKRPHKNQEVLVRAAALLPDDVVTLFAGHPEPYDQYLRALAAELGVEDRVRFADYVPDGDLETLWGLADAAAFPTLAEGFGLPLVEAMARGLPVVASDIPVLREVGGDVPRFFDPRDPASVAVAIQDAVADPRPNRPGLERAARYTWDAAAEATWAVYEDACASG